MTTTFTPIDAPLAETAPLRRTSELLRSHLDAGGEVRLVLSGPTNEGIVLPSSALNLLVEGLAELGKGHSIRVVPQESELTTLEACELLHLSHAFFLGLIHRGVIPASGSGSERRIKLQDVLTYKTHLDAERLDAMRTLIAEAEDMDLGYSP